jgi:hypothetical protein
MQTYICDTKQRRHFLVRPGLTGNCPAAFHLIRYTPALAGTGRGYIRLTVECTGQMAPIEADLLYNRGDRLVGPAQQTLRALEFEFSKGRPFRSPERRPHAPASVDARHWSTGSASHLAPLGA